MPSVVNILFDYLDPPQTATLNEHSWLLSGISSFPDDQALAFMAEEDEGMRLGGSFERLKPRDGNEFKIELGAALPDWLPNVDGSPEYFLDVKDETGATRRLCVSNQMTRLIYVSTNHQFQVILPRSRLFQVYGDAKFGVPDDAPTARVKSMASMRFAIVGATAQDALEKNVKACIDVFIACLNLLVVAELTIGKASYLPPLAPAYDMSTFDALYFIIQGRDSTIFANWRITTSLRRLTQHPPHNFNGSDANRLRSLLRGEEPIDDVAKIMHTARSYAEGGLLEYALLQLVIAAEIATTRFVHKMLLANGVPKNRLDDVRRDMTFSMMLNVSVMSLSPLHMKPDLALLSKINDGRKKRNELMHEGYFAATREYIRELHEATQVYVQFLDRVLQDASAACR